MIKPNITQVEVTMWKLDDQILLVFPVPIDKIYLSHEQASTLALGIMAAVGEKKEPKQ